MPARPTAPRPVFRTVLVLLALLDLVVGGVRLWPWSAAMHLGGSAITLIAPVVCLIVYILLALWIGSAPTEVDRKWLMQAGSFGVLGGALLIGVVGLASLHVPEDFSPHIRLQIILAAAAVLLWGSVAARMARAGRAPAFAIEGAVWSALVSSLMACTALLAETFAPLTPDEMPDPWGVLQQHLMGAASNQPLAHALNAATVFLIAGPIAAYAAGMLFGLAFRRRKVPA